MFSARIEALGLALALGASLSGGCYLTSEKPTAKKLEVADRDRRAAEQINGILIRASDFVRDLSRFNQFAVGALAPSENISSFTDIPEYTTLFSPGEPEPTEWRDDEKSGTSRFSRDIWNESVYLFRRQNPNFHLRAEGRQSREGELEALVLAIDSGRDVSANSSETIFSSQRRCAAGQECTATMRIDHASLAKAFGMEMPGERTNWGSTKGVLVARVLGDTTSAVVENYLLNTKKVTLTIAKMKYEHVLGSRESPVEANGTIKLRDFDPTIFFASIPKEVRDLLPASLPTEIVLDYVAKGNIREPGSLVFTFSRPSRGEQP